MMNIVLIKGSYTVLMFLEWLILLYIVSIWLLPDCWLRRTLAEHVDPFFIPVRFLLKKSVMRCKWDFSYLITLLIIFYLKSVMRTLI